MCVRCRVLALSGPGASSRGSARLPARSSGSMPERVRTRRVGASRRRACGGRGRGNTPLLGARGPAPASPRAHLASAAHLLGGRGVSGGGSAGPGGARQCPAEGGRRLIPGIPRASALASAAEPAWRAPPACACGCAEGESVRERGRERACASARPRSAPRAPGGPASTPRLPPTGPGRPEAGEPRAAPR